MKLNKVIRSVRPGFRVEATDVDGIVAHFTDGVHVTQKAKTKLRDHLCVEVNKRHWVAEKSDGVVAAYIFRPDLVAKQRRTSSKPRSTSGRWRPQRVVKMSAQASAPVFA